MIFGDQKVLAASTTATDSFIVAIDGVTGAEKGKECAVPKIYLYWERDRPFQQRLLGRRASKPVL